MSQYPEEDSRSSPDEINSNKFTDSQITRILTKSTVKERNAIIREALRTESFKDALAWLKSHKFIESNNEEGNTLTGGMVCKRGRESSAGEKDNNNENADSLEVTSTYYGVLNPLVNDQDRAQMMKPFRVYVGTDTLLKEHENYSPNPGRIHSLKEFFSVKGLDGNEADIVIVSGKEGSGKTKLAQHIVEMRLKDKDPPVELRQLCNVFYTDLKVDRNRSFAELFDKTFANLKKKFPGTDVEDTMLSYPFWVLLDGFDDSIGCGKELVRELLQSYCYEKKVIVTCRPQYVDTVYSLIPKPKRKCTTHLCLNPLSPSLLGQKDIISHVMDVRLALQQERERHLIKSGLISRLPLIKSAIGDDICNPLMLFILIGMWFEHPAIELGSNSGTLKDFIAMLP